VPLTTTEYDATCLARLCGDVEHFREQVATTAIDLVHQRKISNFDELYFVVDLLLFPAVIIRSPDQQAFISTRLAHRLNTHSWKSSFEYCRTGLAFLRARIRDTNNEMRPVLIAHAIELLTELDQPLLAALHPGSYLAKMVDAACLPHDLKKHFTHYIWENASRCFTDEFSPIFAWNQWGAAIDTAGTLIPLLVELYTRHDCSLDQPFAIISGIFSSAPHLANTLYSRAVDLCQCEANTPAELSAYFEDIDDTTLVNAACRLASATIEAGSPYLGVLKSPLTLSSDARELYHQIKAKLPDRQWDNLVAQLANCERVSLTHPVARDVFVLVVRELVNLNCLESDFLTPIADLAYLIRHDYFFTSDLPRKVAKSFARSIKCALELGFSPWSRARLLWCMCLGVEHLSESNQSALLPYINRNLGHLLAEQGRSTVSLRQWGAFVGLQNLGVDQATAKALDQLDTALHQLRAPGVLNFFTLNLELSMLLYLYRPDELRPELATLDWSSNARFKKSWEEVCRRAHNSPFAQLENAVLGEQRISTPIRDIHNTPKTQIINSFRRLYQDGYEIERLRTMLDEIASSSGRPRKRMLTALVSLSYRAALLTSVHSTDPAASAAANESLGEYLLDSPPYALYVSRRSMELTPEAQACFNRIAEIYRRGFDLHLGFNALSFEARRPPNSNSNLLMRYASDLAVVRHHIRVASNDIFPGPGVMTSGMKIDRALMPDRNVPDDQFWRFKERWRWGADQIEDLSRTRIGELRGVLFFIPPPETHYTVRDVHYSLYAENAHGYDPFGGGVWGVATDVLYEGIRSGACGPTNRSGDYQVLDFGNGSALHIDTLAERSRERGLPILNLSWPSNYGGMCNAYAPRNTGTHDWERKLPRNDTQDKGGHSHKSHILGYYQAHMSPELETALAPLAKLDVEVHGVFRRLFNLYDLNRLIRALWHKGLTMDRFDPESSDFPDVTEVDQPMSKRETRMLRECYRWYHRSHAAEITDIDRFPVLVIADTLDYQNRPPTSVTLDTYSLELTVHERRWQLPTNSDGAGERECAIWQNYVRPLYYDRSDLDLRLYDRRQL